MARNSRTGRTEENREPGILPRILKGALAGFIATAPMTLSMAIMHRLLPREEQHPLPPRKIAEVAIEKTGGVEVKENLDESERSAATMVSHFMYGAAAGALYPLLAKESLPPVLGGIAFGHTVWAGSYLGLLPAMGILHPEDEHPSRHALMIVAHIVWGSVMGLIVDCLEGKADTRDG